MLGALMALGAALAFGSGSVLQKVGAPPADALGIRRLAAHVVTSPTYLLGTSLDVFGFVLTAVAGAAAGAVRRRGHPVDRRRFHGGARRLGRCTSTCESPPRWR